MKWLPFLWVIICLVGCQTADWEELRPITPRNQDLIPTPVHRYLFLGHIRSYDPLAIYDPRLNNLDLSKFHQIFLLGDLADNTTGTYAPLHSLDQRFNLSSETVHWVPGNHDYAYSDRISEYSGRPIFYSFQTDGIQFLLFDTQRDKCEIRGTQREMLDQVLDTTRAHTVVLLTHKLIWLYLHPEIHSFGWQIPNGGVCNTSEWCLFPNHFMEEIFPKIDSVAKSGKAVYCIAGDIGINYKAFEFTNENGVHFLATGLGKGSDQDQVLVFEQKMHGHSLSYSFYPLNDLIKQSPW